MDNVKITPAKGEGKIKANISLESSLIGIAYFTRGNPYLQPGTANLAVEWQQELLHSKFLVDYKINVSHYLSTMVSGSSNKLSGRQMGNAFVYHYSLSIQLLSAVQ